MKRNHAHPRKKLMPIILGTMLTAISAQAQWNGSSVNTTTNSNVGIGTSSPVTDLHIVHNAIPGTSSGGFCSGCTKMHPAFKIQATTVNNSSPATGTNDINLLEITHHPIVFGNHQPDKTLFSVRTNINNSTRYGLVGINKAEPTEALDVDGNIKTNGTVWTYNLNTEGSIFMYRPTDGNRAIHATSSTGSLDITSGSSYYDGASMRMFANNSSFRPGATEFISNGAVSGSDVATVFQNNNGYGWNPLMHVYKNGDVRIYGNLMFGNGLTGSKMATTTSSGALSTESFPGLSLSGSTLTLSNGGSINSTVTIPTGSGDNLGTHKATTLLDMDNHDIALVNKIELREINFRSGLKFTSTAGGTQHHGTFGINAAPISGKALTVAGDVQINGSGHINTAWTTSDKRYKTNISAIEKQKNKLFDIKSYTYKYNKEVFPGKGFDDLNHFGFMAQEIEQVFPNLVKKDDEGYYAVNYVEFIPLLLEAVKEEHQKKVAQDEKIVVLEEKLTLLESMLQSCCNSKSASKSEATSAAATELLNQRSTLYQNVPNPFDKETIIGFNIVEKYNRAFIGIYDLNGRQISTINIAQGSNKVSFSSDNLIPGMYVYSLVVDNNLIDSKRMVIMKD